MSKAGELGLVGRFRTLGEIQTAISEGNESCTSLVSYYLQRIRQYSDLNAFLETFEEESLQRAEIIDQKIKEGKAGKLAGLVLGIKDILCYRGHKLTASSKILSGFDSLITATVIQKLEAEDAIVIGRQNCDEFAMGSSNENSAYGPVKNPVDTTKVTGGSSGGSAAAVAADLCHVSLGSDTGGSVRQPAGFCGVYGIKPTYGRVSRYGLIAYASSFDQIGPLTHSLEDSARIMEVMAGHDPQDNISSSKPVDAYSQFNTGTKSSYSFGLIREIMESPGLDEEIRQLILRKAESLEAAGHTIKWVDFPLMPYVVPCYYILTTAEASSNLSRYDGIRYGHRSPSKADLIELYKQSRTEGFGDEVKRRIMLGTFVLSAGYYDAYYTKAMKVRRLIKNQTLSILQEVDGILTPTAPTTAFSLGEKTTDPIEMYLTDIFTVHANLAGLPAISIPAAKHSNGLPMGLQILGKAFEEKELYHLAHLLDTA
ncbi:MAG: Asp-tRNA(Asn)/Glu-tRNA(Gln) amidotransferase subunit GatA [Bacteroidota bacterium]